MVRAYHLILTCYGFWLPNDPRGSFSSQVWSNAIREFGEATKVNTHLSVAHRPHDHNARHAAKQALLRPPIHFSGKQAQLVAQGIGEIAKRNNLIIHACAVMPDHVHLVVDRHATIDAEGMVHRVKAKATQSLNAADLGFGGTPWCKGRWIVYLNAPEDVDRATRYVQQNPIKAGLRQQRWSFVQPSRNLAG
ncbi:MAG: transposase [Planctomycetota bacterium]